MLTPSQSSLNIKSPDNIFNSITSSTISNDFMIEAKVLAFKQNSTSQNIFPPMETKSHTQDTKRIIPDLITKYSPLMPSVDSDHCQIDSEVEQRRKLLRRQLSDEIKLDVTSASASDSDHYHHEFIKLRKHRCMSEEERFRRERKLAFQQKYRQTQRLLESSSNDVFSRNLTYRDNEMSTNARSSHFLSDSEVFLDTDDDGMDTVSEITIDLV